MTNSHTSGIGKTFPPLSILIVFLMLFYPLTGMLWHHGYPVFSKEILLLVSGMLLTSILVSALLSRVDWKPGNLILVVIFTVSLMIHFNLMVTGILLTFALSTTIAILLRGKFQTLLTAVLLALTAGSYLDNQVDRVESSPAITAATTSNNRGPLIHIVIDGMIGPDGLPISSQADGLRAQMLEFFQDRGFETYTRAYSHYNNTIDSLTHAFNFRNGNENFFQQYQILNLPLSINENAWFRALKDLGYRVNVYQTEGIDFCGVSDVSRCMNYTLPNLKSIHDGIEDAGGRINALLRTLFGQSQILTRALSGSVELSSWGVANYDRRLLRDLAADIRRAPQDAFFAHLLIPHPPLVFKEDCSLDYSGPSWLRYTASGGDIGNSQETRQQRYPRYIAQSRCMLSELGRFFADLEEAGIYETATIIVHGDHGSMAFNYNPIAANLDKLRYRDLRESYSTSFAIKYPSQVASINEEITSLNVLIARTLTDIADVYEDRLDPRALNEDNPFIYLSGVIPLQLKYINIFTRNPEDSDSEQ